MAKRRATDDKMGELHEVVAKRLLEELNKEDCPPAVFTAAIKFLKDNNIESVMEVGSPLKALFDGMPQFEDE